MKVGDLVSWLEKPKPCFGIVGEVNLSTQMILFIGAELVVWVGIECLEKIRSVND